MAAQATFDETARGKELELESDSAQENVKLEAVIDAAKTMMGSNFQHVIGALLEMLPGYEQMLVRSSSLKQQLLKLKVIYLMS